MYFDSKRSLPSLTSFRIPSLFLTVLPPCLFLQAVFLSEDFLFSSVQVHLLPRQFFCGHAYLQVRLLPKYRIFSPRNILDCRKPHISMLCLCSHGCVRCSIIRFLYALPVLFFFLPLPYIPLVSVHNP